MTACLVLVTWTAGPLSMCGSPQLPVDGDRFPLVRPYVIDWLYGAAWDLVDDVQDRP